MEVSRRRKWRILLLSATCVLLPMVAAGEQDPGERLMPPPPAAPPAVIHDVGPTNATTPPDPTIVNPLIDPPGTDDTPDPKVMPLPEFAYEVPPPKHMPFVDRAHLGVFNAVWRSAMRFDGMFGGGYNERVYQNTSGSLAPSLMWDEFDGFRPRLRFQVDVPLPHLNERLHAFIGRVNRDEYVTERKQESGAIANQFGPAEQDETLLGIRYREPRQGGRFEADAGLRVRSPLDPFVKGSYQFTHGKSEGALWGLRETAFWQNSEKFGVTSRIDFEHIFKDTWLLRWTGSGTMSERTMGVRGYTALTMMRGLPGRRALAAEVFTQGEFKAPVPTKDFGAKLAYRRSIARDWLVLETRLSCTFPREELTQQRKASFGVGIGLEMFFGTDDFLARPVTF